MSSSSSEGSYERERRENVDKVRIGKKDLSRRWSDWELVMGPHNSQDLTKRRSGSGYTLHEGDLDIQDKAGIYEFAIGVTCGRHKRTSLYPVYVGSTCRCDNRCTNANNMECGLKTRILEYCRNGSHKDRIFNQAIEHNMNIFVRTRKVLDAVRGWRKMEMVARTAENDLLDVYDYAWNIRENDKECPRSVEGIELKRIKGHKHCPFCKEIGL